MSFEDFSLPKMAISQDDQDLEFKFCSVMEPGASPDSPADHLFSNGQLVPHDFPCSSSKKLNFASRSTSWGSSKDGSEFSSSSRSNSCSSSQRSSSSSNSSITSTSGAISERRVLIRARRPRSSANKRAPEAYKVRKHVWTPENGSRMWQFIAAAPVLNANVLHKSGKVEERNRAESADEKGSENKKEGKSKGCWKRFLCLFVSACNEFHAIQPSTRGLAPGSATGRSGSQRSSSMGSNGGFESFSSSWSHSCSSSQRSSSYISSGRTSTSDETPDRTELNRAVRAKRKPEPYKAHKHVSTPDYGSRMWQFIAPAPALNRNVVHRSRKVSKIRKDQVAGHQKVSKAKKEGKSTKFFSLFVSSCSEFHAIEPLTTEY